MSLSELLERKPGSQLAFCDNLEAPSLLETVVSFANADGGNIVAGINQQGRVTGNLQSEDADALVHQALLDIRPPVLVEVEPYDLPQGTVLVFKVPSSRELHTLADGRILVRRGADNVVATGGELAMLATSRSGGSFEQEEMLGATIDDFDPDVVEEYAEKRKKRQPRAFVGASEALLRQTGAINAEGKVTVAGMILFGRDPAAFLPQCGLTFVKFAGTDRRGDTGQIGYGRRADITGPMARIVERAWQVIFEAMDKRSIVRGLVNEQETEYPSVAVREALVNAVAHRDYRVAGRRIEVLMFRDRLEISSPGGLPGYITVQNIVDEHYSRNPRLVNGLMQWGYIEELGLGVDKMIEGMVAQGHPPPEFRATSHAFTVTLRKGREVGEPGVMPSWEQDMNERQMQALQHVQRHGRITNRDYRQLCPHVSAETLRLDLVDLVDKGLLLKIGEKKGTYYILKRRASA